MQFFYISFVFYVSFDGASFFRWSIVYIKVDSVGWHQNATSSPFMNHEKCVRNVFLSTHTQTQNGVCVLTTICIDSESVDWPLSLLHIINICIVSHGAQINAVFLAHSLSQFSLVLYVYRWISFFPFLPKWIQRNFSFTNSYQAYARAQRIWVIRWIALRSLHAVRKSAMLLNNHCFRIKPLSVYEQTSQFRIVFEFAT